MRINSLVKAFRKEHKLTKKEFAMLIGISKKSIIDNEQNNKCYNEEDTKKILKILCPLATNIESYMENKNEILQ